MYKYANIAFATAVRKEFTYRVNAETESEIQVGMRVWVPFREYNAIGVVVALHNNKPDFEVKSIKKVLDEKPILNQEMLSLIDWVHQFYYCSRGEVIQAALPAGLNFISNKYVRVAQNAEINKLQEVEKELIAEILDKGLLFDDAHKRWKGTKYAKYLKQLISEGVLEVWEEPKLKIETKIVSGYKWKSAEKLEEAHQKAKNEEPKYKWEKALHSLINIELPLQKSELKKLKNITDYTLAKLETDGWIESIKMETQNEFSTLKYNPEEIKLLNGEQNVAYQTIESHINEKKYGNFLLYGITGSGKTEVYIHALKKVIEMGRGGIVLVPEIALTPQTVSRFYKIFSDKIAVLHSRMNARERLIEWRQLKSGAKKIAIGPRSAVFAPVQDLGIIILDEEHDSSYKQIDPAPRYHARETAIMRAHINNAVVIMGSATPSMQALSMAAKNKSTLLKLTKRHADAKLPEVNIIDLRQYKNAMKGNLSAALYHAIKKAIGQKEQIILLYNRRGFANYLQCQSCGHIPQSPECSVSLTYHKHKNLLMCHYSGYARRVDKFCENCGSEDLEIKGSGTQKIEEELKEFFPDAKILRFDRDTTSKKDAHNKILSKFGNGDADILVGTQLVAKGLDFPNVTVVGVIDADTELAFPSFQSSENMYQLLSQVAGRSGRGEKAGAVYIQTRNPEIPAIQFAKYHNHEGFSKEEMAFRKVLNYPPYSRLVKFIFKGKEEKEVKHSAQLMHNILSKLVPDLETLGPSPASIAWMNNRYIWELTLKIMPTKGANYVEKLLDKLLQVYRDNSKISEFKVRININVDTIL